MYQKFKQKVFEIIQPAVTGCVASKVCDIFLMGMILASVTSVFISTFDPPEYLLRRLGEFEIFAVAVFTLECLLRVWTANLLYPELREWKARLRYLRSGMALIDLLSILPFYLPFIIPVNLLGLRALRLTRLLRMFKLNRYSEALASIGTVFRQKSQEILASLFCVLLLLIVASLLIYYVEHDAQPDRFQNAFSGLWWAVATLTTVGYGDIYPVTAAGKILGAIIAILGIGMVAIPTGILSAGFMEHLSHNDKHGEKMTYCPYCGKKLK